jgi:hypothetical protein
MANVVIDGLTYLLTYLRCSITCAEPGFWLTPDAGRHMECVRCYTAGSIGNVFFLDTWA